METTRRKRDCGHDSGYAPAAGVGDRIRIDMVNAAEMSYAEGLRYRLAALRRKKEQARREYDSIPVVPGTYGRMIAAQRRVEAIEHAESETVHFLSETERTDEH